MAKMVRGTENNNGEKKIQRISGCRKDLKLTHVTTSMKFTGGKKNMNNNGKKKATWIVVTGLDGSGKTNLVQSLEEHYKALGLKVKTAHLPYSTHLQREVLPKLKHRYSDRLMFALDNHYFASDLETWLYQYDIIISQRGFLDSFVHGAVQGYSYEFIANLNDIEMLPKADVMIHLVADAATAYDRIKDDPDADKFEYPAYIKKQETETRRGYYELTAEHNKHLFAFKDAKNILIDTTNISMEETFDRSLSFLDGIGIGSSDA